MENGIVILSFNWGTSWAMFNLYDLVMVNYWINSSNRVKKLTCIKPSIYDDSVNSCLLTLSIFLKGFPLRESYL